jgi:hypothetical protein
MPEKLYKDLTTIDVAESTGISPYFLVALSVNNVTLLGRTLNELP